MGKGQQWLELGLNLNHVFIITFIADKAAAAAMEANMNESTFIPLYLDNSRHYLVICTKTFYHFCPTLPLLVNIRTKCS